MSKSMKIGDKIRERRMELSISQTELAELVGTTKQNVYKYENNIITNIPSDKIEHLAKALKTTPAYLMGWSDVSDIQPNLSELKLNIPCHDAVMLLAQKRNMTLGDLEKELDISEGELQKEDYGMLSWEHMVKMANYFNVPEEYFLTLALHDEYLEAIHSLLWDVIMLLNDDGKLKVMEYVNDLADNPKYQKESIKITPLSKSGNSERVELKIEGDTPYIPDVAAAHHPTGKLSDADKKDIAFLNELVGKMKKEKGDSQA